MLDWTYFASAVGLTLTLSLTVALVIRAPLLSVLKHICGTDIGARFWTTYACVMIVVGPLFLVAGFVKDGVDLIHFLRSTVAMTAFGLIGTFIIMGWAVGRSIHPAPKENRQVNVFAPAQD